MPDESLQSYIQSPVPDGSTQYRDLTGRVRKISDMYFAYGGFSEVFKGIYEDESGLQHSVAIKVIRTVVHERETLLKVTSEPRSRGAAHIKTSKCVRISWHNIGPYFALVSSYCAKGDITQYFEDHPQSNRLHLILDVAKAIEYLHINNVVHGDIKGANVLIADDDRPLLADFGRSSIISTRGFTTSTTAGSARYAAPEIIRHHAQQGQSNDADSFTILTQETDVYSFSMVGVEILSGKHSYPSIRNDNRIINGVPDGLRPRREEYQLSRLHAKIWDILELCWVQIPTERLTMVDIVQELSNTS